MRQRILQNVLVPLSLQKVVVFLGPVYTWVAYTVGTGQLAVDFWSVLQACCEPRNTCKHVILAHSDSVLLKELEVILRAHRAQVQKLGNSGYLLVVPKYVLFFST